MSLDTALDGIERAHRNAVSEFIDMIRSRYPSATFSVRPGVDDPEATYLVTTVDLDDPDEVMDLVIERMIELQVDEGIPVHVVPIHTPQRVAEIMREAVDRRHVPEALVQ